MPIIFIDVYTWNTFEIASIIFLQEFSSCCLLDSASFYRTIILIGVISSFGAKCHFYITIESEIYHLTRIDVIKNVRTLNGYFTLGFLVFSTQNQMSSLAFFFASSISCWLIRSLSSSERERITS